MECARGLAPIWGSFFVIRQHTFHIIEKWKIVFGSIVTISLRKQRSQKSTFTARSPALPRRQTARALSTYKYSRDMRYCVKAFVNTFVSVGKNPSISRFRFRISLFGAPPPGWPKGFQLPMISRYCASMRESSERENREILNFIIIFELSNLIRKIKSENRLNVNSDVV